MSLATMKVEKKKLKFMDYGWIFSLMFFLLGVVDIRFGVLGIICMGLPVVYGIMNQGRKGCTMCPRSASLGLLKRISLGKIAPKWLLSNRTKLIIFIAIITNFAFGLYGAWGSMEKIGALFVRMFTISGSVAVIMGIMYKEKTWCVVCPMGNLAMEITKAQNKKKVKNG